MNITGGILDFSSAGTVSIQDAVTFDNIQLTFATDSAQNIYANGYRVEIGENVTFNDGAYVNNIYAGGNGTTVMSTDLTLLAGNYKTIYGGGSGSSNVVLGNTYLHIAGNANASRELTSTNASVIYGAGANGAVYGNTNVYVAGNVNKQLDFTASKSDNAVLYGGGNTTTIKGSTNITVEGSANFDVICGGGYNGTIEGNTNITVRGNVNTNLDAMAHSSYALVYGGSYGGNAVVEGNTKVEVAGYAKFNYIYGGAREYNGEGHYSSVGNTSVTFGENAQSMSIYGGSSYGENGNTKVVMTGGTVEQVFGGCDRTSMTGNTDVQLLGGIVKRRVYGGCYNDYSTSSGWVQTDCRVIGNTSVTISPDVTFEFDTSLSDRGVLAGSRYKTTFSDEVGTIIFLDDAADSKSGVLGRQDSALVLATTIGDLQAYHYLVKAPAGGTVTSQGSTLLIKPDSADAKVSVSGIDGSYLADNGDGTYTLTLPAIDKDAQTTITITFN